MKKKVKPVVLPGLTKVYKSDVLDYIGDWYTSSYGSGTGIPCKSSLRDYSSDCKINRKLSLPFKEGLQVLYRVGQGLELMIDPSFKYEGGIIFAKQKVSGGKNAG